MSGSSAQKHRNLFLRGDFIWYRGQHDGRVVRFCTGTRSWRRARHVRDKFRERIAASQVGPLEEAHRRRVPAQWLGRLMGPLEVAAIIEPQCWNCGIHCEVLRNTRACTYIVQEDGECSAKVGWTRRRPLDRIIELQTGNPRELLLRCVVADPDRLVERCLHQQFVAMGLQARSEWFRVDAAFLVVLGCSLKDQHYQVYGDFVWNPT